MVAGFLSSTSPFLGKGGVGTSTSTTPVATIGSQNQMGWSSSDPALKKGRKGNGQTCRGQLQANSAHGDRLFLE